jgi:hypothetical protein
MLATLARSTFAASARRHIVVAQDTTEINFAGRVANRRFVSGKPRLLGRSFLPVSLQRPRHQVVLRLGAGITATGLVDLILRAFQTLTPLLLQGGALGLQSGGNSKTEPDAAGSNACRTMDVTCSSTGAAFSDWQKGRP